MEEKEKILKWTKPSLKRIGDELSRALGATCGTGSGAADCVTVGANPVSLNCGTGTGTADCVGGSVATFSCTGGTGL